MKKLLSLFLAMVFSVSVFSLNALAAPEEKASLSQELMALPMEDVVHYVKTHDVEYDELRSALLEREWASYDGDKEFARHYAEDATSAREMVQRNVENQLELIQDEVADRAVVESSSLAEQLKDLPMEDIVSYVKTHDIEQDALRGALLEREWASYDGDVEFARHYAEDPVSARVMIQRNVENQLNLIQDATTIQPNSGNSTNAWVDPILIKQKNSYYCGPCSALQEITAYGGSVAGSTNDAKQDTLANAMQTNSSVGTYVYKVSNVLNTYVSGYSYKRGSEMSDYSFRQTVLKSLVNNKAPILHARTQYLSYYNNHSTGHYICVTAINNNTDKIRLSDCNRDSRYYGTRSIPTSEAKASVSASERYLISTSLS